MSLLGNIFREQSSEYLYPMTKIMFFKVIIAALMSGVAVWVLTLSFDKLMISQVFCGAGRDIAMCVNSLRYSSYIALILVAILLIPILLVTGIKRPLLVAIAATISLWGVAMWTGGVWLISLLWTVVAFMLVYATLVWVNRIRGNGAAVLLLAIVTVVAQFVLMA